METTKIYVMTGHAAFHANNRHDAYLRLVAYFSALAAGEHHDLFLEDANVQIMTESSYHQMILK